MSHISGKITVAFELVEVVDEGHDNPLAVETARRSIVFNVDESDEEFRAAVERRWLAYDAKWAGGETFNTIG